MGVGGEIVYCVVRGSREGPHSESPEKRCDITGRVRGSSI